MAYRNWKHEFEDKRRHTPRRRKGWILAALLVLVAATICLLWVWPGWLRDGRDQDGAPDAEDLYLTLVASHRANDAPSPGVES